MTSQNSSSNSDSSSSDSEVSFVITVKKKKKKKRNKKGKRSPLLCQFCINNCKLNPSSKSLRNPCVRPPLFIDLTTDVEIKKEKVDPCYIKSSTPRHIENIRPNIDQAGNRCSALSEDDNVEEEGKKKVIKIKNSDLHQTPNVEHYCNSFAKKIVFEDECGACTVENTQNGQNCCSEGEKRKQKPIDGSGCCSKVNGSQNSNNLSVSPSSVFKKKKRKKNVEITNCTLLSETQDVSVKEKNPKKYKEAVRNYEQHEQSLTINTDSPLVEKQKKKSKRKEEGTNISWKGKNETMSHISPIEEAEALPNVFMNEKRKRKKKKDRETIELAITSDMDTENLHQSEESLDEEHDIPSKKNKKKKKNQKDTLDKKHESPLGLCIQPNNFAWQSDVHINIKEEANATILEDKTQNKTVDEEQQTILHVKKEEEIEGDVHHQQKKKKKKRKRTIIDNDTISDAINGFIQEFVTKTEDVVLIQSCSDNIIKVVQDENKHDGIKEETTKSVSVEDETDIDFSLSESSQQSLESINSTTLLETPKIEQKQNAPHFNDSFPISADFFDNVKSETESDTSEIADVVGQSASCVNVANDGTTKSESEKPECILPPMEVSECLEIPDNVCVKKEEERDSCVGIQSYNLVVNNNDSIQQRTCPNSIPEEDTSTERKSEDLVAGVKQNEMQESKEDLMPTEWSTCDVSNDFGSMSNEDEIIKLEFTPPFSIDGSCINGSNTVQCNDIISDEKIDALTRPSQAESRDVKLSRICLEKLVTIFEQQSREKKNETAKSHVKNGGNDLNNLDPFQYSRCSSEGGSKENIPAKQMFSFNKSRGGKTVLCESNVFDFDAQSDSSFSVNIRRRKKNEKEGLKTCSLVELENFCDSVSRGFQEEEADEDGDELPLVCLKKLVSSSLEKGEGKGMESSKAAYVANKLDGGLCNSESYGVKEPKHCTSSIEYSQESEGRPSSSKEMMERSRKDDESQMENVAKLTVRKFYGLDSKEKVENQKQTPHPLLKVDQSSEIDKVITSDSECSSCDDIDGFHLSSTSQEEKIKKLRQTKSNYLENLLCDWNVNPCYPILILQRVVNPLQ